MANLKSLEWPFQADGNDHSKKARMTILTTTRFFKEEKALGGAAFLRHGIQYGMAERFIEKQPRQRGLSSPQYRIILF